MRKHVAAARTPMQDSQEEAFRRFLSGAIARDSNADPWMLEDDAVLRGDCTVPFSEAEHEASKQLPMTNVQERWKSLQL